MRPTSKTPFSQRLAAFRDTADSWFDGTVDSVDRRAEKCSTLLAAASGAVSNDNLEHLATVAELTADHRALAAMRDDLLTGASGREAGETPPGRRFTSGGPHLPPAKHYDENRPLGDIVNELAQGLTNQTSIDIPHDFGALHTEDHLHPVHVMASGKDYQQYVRDYYDEQESHDAENDVKPEEKRHPIRDFFKPHDNPWGILPKQGSADPVRWVVLEAAAFVRENSDAIYDRGELTERARRHAAVISPSLVEPFAAEVASYVRPRPKTASAPVFTDFPDSSMFL
jgi:hypothetical protein